MTAQTIVVAGFGRCGTSLTMQMLQAGGVPCLGQWPAFEDTRANAEITPELVAEGAGKAMKVLDPHRVGLPGDVRVIWLDREIKEQARSLVKFTRMTMGRAYSRDARRALEEALSRDRRAVMQLIGSRPVMGLNFEHILAKPEVAARRIAEFIAPVLPVFDVEGAAKVVRRRSPRCAPGLDLELELIQEGAPC